MRKRQCPCCKGTGFIEPAVMNMPNGYITMRHVAALAGNSRKRIADHRKLGLLTATYGIIRLKGRCVYAWLVKRDEADRYLAWLRECTGRYARTKVDDQIALAKEGASPEAIAAVFNVDRSSVLTNFSRRKFDWRAYEGVGRPAHRVGVEARVA